ncbi:phytanoyl-CoA dioxygenase family protein [Paenibacillus lignilyticus]|uniref:Phytanoyl-CoA dioxygenase family protein n=1 Tax=Paenibacillus lignilyticus TaxID=1172615 RepID=A0ABS5C6W7_9BACL|nr:phytanoyl-CoA dioxygenase family protein [Paenibacillus lignilyticus]MBP3961741.1 phytanoyl-CoA dioxygenase family protein [Paenibacillus lignilyticus]MBP3963588.1 phytanoyl-CoA dioxygenase family protein [Paenibacillus lignilyticus]
MRIKLTEQELATGQLNPETLETAAEQVKVNGYILFEKVLSDEKIKTIRDSFDPIFDEYIDKRGYNTGTNRAQMFLPFMAPFNDSEVIAHPIVMSVIEKVLGRGFHCSYFASDTPMPGSDYQAVHCDIMPLFPELTVPLPAFSLVVNIPLVDVNEVNGPLEIWPGGTHLNPDNANHDTLDGSINPNLHIVRAAEGMLSEKVFMPAGSIVIRDIRMWHRGTPNRSDDRRTNLAMIFNRHWYNSSTHTPIPRETYDAMTAKEKEVYRNFRIGQPVAMPWE